MLFKLKKFQIPEDDIDAFRILKDNKIIDNKLYNNLKDAKSMRNIIAHQYGKINDEIVFDSIKKELERDTEAFIQNVEKYIKRNKKK